MDLKTLLPFLTLLPTSVLVAALIDTLRNRSVRTFENRTKRIQFWKTMLEVAPLADVSNLALIKEQCQHEMVVSADMAAMESNEFVSDLSTLVLFGVEVLVVCIMTRMSSDMLDIIKRNGAPPTIINELVMTLFVMQAVVLLLVWLLGARAIRRSIWNKIKLRLQNRVFQRAVGLLTVVLVMVTLLLGLYLLT
jgi:hypothetical protein